MNIFEKLSMARQISFHDGKIILLDQRVSVVPVEFLASITKTINDSSDQVFEVYSAAKTAVREGFAKRLGEAYDFKFRDYSQWLVDIATMSGWGRLEWADLDFDNKRGVIAVTDSPIGSKLSGQVDSPVDHVIRGLMAGGASHSFNADVDILETECVALGDPKCKFVIQSPKEFLKSDNPLVKKQLSGIK